MWDAADIGNHDKEPWATGRSCEGKYGREEGPEGPIILELKILRTDEPTKII